MSNIQLLIANANNNFSSDGIEKINKAVLSAEKFISDNFTFDYEVDVIIVPSSLQMSVIPEDGVGGRTYRSDLIIIVIDEDSEISQDYIYEILCHELAHSLRWQKVPEFTACLYDDIILEGLAVVLEEKAMAGKENCQYFLKEVQNTEQSTIDDILSALNGSLNEREYDYNKIFMSGDDSLPRWAGYRLGYYFVNKYLSDNSVDIFQATLSSYDKFKS